MGSTNISIKEDAYEFLKSRKGAGMSFSDVILGFKKEKSPLDFFGVLRDKDWSAAEENMRAFRKSFDERFKK